METTEDFSPYCPKCDACGEEGCCSPINCKQSPEGHYCERYLADLKFGYHMNRWAEENIIEKLPEELKAAYDEEWEKAYDRHYDTPKPNKTEK